jgi:hypothetical protein
MFIAILSLPIDGGGRACLPAGRGGREGLLMARLQWHAVKKVDHYYLSIDAVTQPMQVREGKIPYGDRKK